MAEKVFGFKEKDMEFFPWGGITKCYVEKHKKVPVVSLEWLKDHCHQHGYYNQQHTFVINLNNLLPEASEQAKKKVDK